MTIYDTFNKLKELTQITKINNGYSKFIQTGNLELFDYNRGFIYFEIYSYKEPSDTDWQIHLSFSTIDDGGLSGWSNYIKTKEKADEIIEKIVNNVFKDMVSFPTVYKLNIMLRPYNIYIEFD